MIISPEKKRIFVAVLAGAIYGIVARIGFDLKAIHPFLQIVSTAFLVVCPFSVGAIAVLWGAGKDKIQISKRIEIALAAIAIFMAAMFITLIEGLICLVLVAPVFALAAIIGGVTAGFLHNNFRANRSTIPVLALLPFLVSPIEGLAPAKPSIQSVTNTIHIAAPPEKVFAHLGSVKDIKPDELGFTFVHLIGLPKPLSAEMSCDAIECTRTSRWEKNVWFQEVITESNAPKAMHYRFSIPKGGIPREALDRHVEIGGEYFDLVDGGYDLRPSEDGGTELSLTTRFKNKSNLELYGNLWGKMVLKDFHRSILGLMKSRSENKG